MYERMDICMIRSFKEASIFKIGRASESICNFILAILKDREVKNHYGQFNHNLVLLNFLYQ